MYSNMNILYRYAFFIEFVFYFDDPRKIIGKSISSKIGNRKYNYKYYYINYNWQS